VASGGKWQVNTRDLDKLERAFRRMRVKLPDAAEAELAEIVGDDAQDAQGFLSGRPGSRGAYKRQPERIGHVDNYRGHPAATIERGGTMVAAEFGTKLHYVWGRPVQARSMKRRVFGARVGRGRLGKVVGKTAERNLPDTERRIAVAFDHAAEAEFRRLGL